MSCVSHAFASVHCCTVATCWKRAVLLALVGDVYCILFVTFPCGILGQVWYKMYVIVLFPHLCRLSYFIKLPFVINIFVMSIFEWLFTQVLLYRILKDRKIQRKHCKMYTRDKI